MRRWTMRGPSRLPFTPTNTASSPTSAMAVRSLSQRSSPTDSAAASPVALRGTGLYSILFVPGGRSYEATHTEFKRVKPYGDRFGVQIGTMKTIDF